ncbi:MAG: dephospho-CoA kinase [Sulfurovum sp.]|nr:MAG: dephospho-CoA kinase [Sulfurovum sp.]
MSFKYAVALTGGIATGKSTVIKLLSEKGFRVIDADKIAHEVLDEKRREIAEMFGEAFVKEGKVDRTLLGSIVFSDPVKRKALESLLHPLIYDRISEASEKLDKRTEPYIIDIPLFYEGGRYGIEKVIVVYAKKKQQLERLMQRDGYDRKEALARIESQIDIEQKRKNASYVINNSTTLMDLAHETARVKEAILGDLL